MPSSARKKKSDRTHDHGRGAGCVPPRRRMVDRDPGLLDGLPFFFFFNDTATTEIYTLSLHDALPVWAASLLARVEVEGYIELVAAPGDRGADRKSTRLNSSHSSISYAVFCLKKKKKQLNILFPIKKKKYKKI